MEQPKRMRPIWQLLIALAAYVLLCFSAQYILVTAVLLAVPCIFVGARYGWAAGGGFVLLGAALCYLLCGPFALLLIGINLLPILAGWYLIRARRRVWESLILSCGAVLLSLGAALALLHSAAEGNIAQYLTEGILQIAKQDAGTAATLFTMLLSGDMASGAVSAEQAIALMYQADIWQYISAESSVSMLKQMIENTLPRLIVLDVFYGGLCNYFLPRLLAKRYGREVVKAPPIEVWRMPGQHGIYMALTLGISYIVLLTGNGAAAAAAQMLFSLTAAAFELIGISTVTYFLTVRIRPRAGRVAIALAVCLLAPGLTTAIGIIEQVFGIRKRFIIVKRNHEGGDKRP